MLFRSTAKKEALAAQGVDIDPTESAQEREAKDAAGQPIRDARGRVLGVPLPDVDRVARLSAALKAKGLADKVVIEVDGGINAETGAEVVKAGARALVAGTYVYGAKHRAEAIQKLKK